MTPLTIRADSLISTLLCPTVFDRFPIKQKSPVWDTLHKEGCPIFIWILISKSNARYICSHRELLYRCSLHSNINIAGACCNLTLTTACSFGNADFSGGSVCNKYLFRNQCSFDISCTCINHYIGSVTAL